MSTGRLADALVTIWIQIDLMKEFFKEYCNVSTEESLFLQMKQKVIPVVIESERVSCVEDPVISYMRALTVMLENKVLYIKKGRFEESDLNIFDGFKDDEYLYLLPHKTYQKIASWVSSGNEERLSVSEKEIASLLCKANYAVSSPNGENKRTIYARISIGKDSKHRANFLKVRRDIIENYKTNQIFADL